MRRVWIGLLCLGFVLLASGSKACAAWDFAAFFESPLNESLGLGLESGTGPAHGIIFLQYTATEGVGRGNRLRVGANTDAAWVALDLHATDRSVWQLSLYANGQLAFAEMTPDYIRGGRHFQELSFNSAYIALGADGRLRLGRFFSLRGQLEGRYWWFSRLAQTHPDFVLPQNSPGLRGRLALEWGKMDRFVARGKLRRGFRASAFTTVMDRSQRRAWGGYRLPSDLLKERRNQSVSRRAARQLGFTADSATTLGSSAAFVFAATVATGWAMDDLQRFKVGGDNPYIPSLSGTYFSEFVVDSYILLHASLMWLPTSWLRIQPMVDGAALSDALRRGRDTEASFVLGTGVVFDFFLRENMRIHVKGSYAFFAPRAGFLPGEPASARRTGGAKVFVGFIGYWWP